MNLKRKRRMPTGRISILIILALLVQVFFPQSAAACQPDIEVMPPFIDFGSVPVGTSSPLQTVTISNNGTYTLTICYIDIIGPDADLFTLTSVNATSNEIPPGTSVSGTIQFLPDSVGDKSATARICSDDPDEQWVYIPLSGKGVHEPDIDVMPMTLDFGNVQVGLPSITQHVTVKNKGTAKLIIYNLVSSDGQFDITGGLSPGDTLAPGASANISLVFTPATTGPQSAKLTITSNDPDESPLDVSLQGNGTEGPVAPEITVTPISVNFGNVVVAASSATKYVTVSNIGTANLIIYSLTTSDGQFDITGGINPGDTILPGALANISLVFTPTTLGPHSANLTITSNDADESPFSVALSGNGTIVTADLRITKTDSKDPVVYGENFTYTLTVTNDGPSDATQVKVADTLPAYVNYISNTPSKGTANETSGTVNWDIGDLANGASATLDIVVNLKASALTMSSIINTATVSGDEYDANTTNNIVNETTTILATDLQITKTDFPDPIGLGDNVTWTVTVTNNGPNDAKNVVAIDVYIPAYTTIHSTTTSAGSIITVPPPWLGDFAAEMSIPLAPPPAGYELLLWDIGDLASGASVNMTIIASANFGLPISVAELPLLALMGLGTLPTLILPNTALVLSPLGDPNFGNNSAYIITTGDTGIPDAELSITKTDSADPVAPGDSVTYTITVRNNGPEGATDVFVLDMWIASQLSYDSSLPSQGTASHSLPTWLSDLLFPSGAPVDTDFLFWDVGALASGATATLTFTATVNAAIPLSAEIANLALVSAPAIDNNSSNNYAWETTSIGQVDLVISKTDSADPVLVSDNFTYVLTVTNNGPDDATGVSVTDTLPAGLTYNSHIESAGTANEAGGVITWDIGDLANGASANLTISVTAPASKGLIINTATVSSHFPDPVPANNSATENTTVAAAGDADLAITKSDSPDPVATNGNLTYTLIVTNNGPADATGVVVTDTLPAGTTYQSNTTSTGTANHASGTVTWNIGSLASGATATIDIIVTAPASTGTITNNASVSGDQTDPVAGNNTTTEDTLVALPTDADLAITKSDSPDPVATGGSLTYTLTVTNNGPGNATGVIVTDILPAGVTYISSGTAIFTAPDKVTWNIAGLANGATANLTILVTAPATAGTITNNASVSGDQADPVAGNNTATEDTEVISVPVYTDLQITKTDSPDPVIAGNSLIYTLTVTNAGPDDATGVSVTDVLPAGLTYNSHTESTGTATEAGGTINWTIGNLNAGSSATLVITTTVTANTGIITNTANISGNEIDLLLVNNTATASTLILPPGAMPDISVVPTSIDFGSVNIGSSSAAQSVTVTNNGTVSLTIYNATVNDGQFTILSGITPGDILAPSASRIITIIFTPAATGSQSASLTITSNDPDENPVNVDLSGTGTTAPQPPPPPPPPPPAGPGIQYFVVDFLGEITEEIATGDGRPTNDMAAPDPDGIHLLEIKALTGAVALGNTVTRIEIREVASPELPENTQLIGKAYEFKPSMTVFDKPVRLTLGYNVNELPEGVTSVGVAFYNPVVGWTYLEAEATSVAELGKLTAPVNHFTIFAILAEVPASEPEPEPKPEPEPTPEPEPELPEPASFGLSNLTITLSEYRVFEQLTYYLRTGAEATITAEITNSGGQTGNYRAVLILNGLEQQGITVTLEPGQTQTVVFDIVAPQTGTYTVAIGELTGEFVSELWVNWWLIAGSGAAVILLAWLIWYIIQRRKQKPTPA
jgi:uncharacterized repeat protein (TIGR01451 family)